MKCLQRILELSRQGYELRRPLADTLRDGVYERRARAGTVHYRILYFFSAKNEAVLSHGITKEGKVDEREINRALKHQRLVVGNKDRHTIEWTFDDHE